jgi:ABC-type Fe3+ transport system permease subunit
MIGCLGLLAFFASGLHMHYGLNHLNGFEDALRLSYRSTHLYLLFTSLMNLALATSHDRPQVGWRKALQFTGSFLLLISPILAGLGFVFEPGLARLYRPFSFYAALTSLSGVLLRCGVCVTWHIRKGISEQKHCE